MQREIKCWWLSVISRMLLKDADRCSALISIAVKNMLTTFGWIQNRRIYRGGQLMEKYLTLCKLNCAAITRTKVHLERRQRQIVEFHVQVTVDRDKFL